MKPAIVLKHEFVECIPNKLVQGIIYVCIPYGTAVHLCCCGCGSEVVTPITPTDWRLIFDGETISLDPSIGNWSFACQSHYWIRRNIVRWAPKWSQVEIDAGRAHDTVRKSRYFDEGPTTITAPSSADRAAGNKEGILKRFWKWYSGA